MARKDAGVGGFFAEFKKFALRGNVIDLAVGVIIGGAFSGITTSLINDLVMPFLGMFLGGVDFSAWIVMLPNLYGGSPTPLNIGNFLQTVVNFIILAFVVFLLVKGINRLHRKAETPPAPPAPSTQEVLLTEIRDLLKEKAE